METLESQIRDVLECPVCIEIPIAPIYICERGHSVCFRCREHITSCPICKGNLTGIRNICVEKISAKIAKPCEYSFYGCSVVSMDLCKRKHEENCRFRPYKCDLPGSIILRTPRCEGLLVMPQNAAEHMRLTHNMEGLTSDTMTILCHISKDELLGKNCHLGQILQKKSQARFLQCYGCLFLCVTTFNSITRSVNLCVCTSKDMITEPNENSFSAQISISSNNNVLSTLTWKGLVSDSKKSLTEVFSSGGCLSLHYENLVSFCKPSQDQHKCVFQVSFTVVRNM